MSEQLAEAGILMAVGMSVVFAFLSLLIGGIHSVAWLAKVFPNNENTALDGNAPSPTAIERTSHNNTAPTTINPNIIAAITAAVNTHRREKK